MGIKSGSCEMMNLESNPVDNVGSHIGLFRNGSAALDRQGGPADAEFAQKIELRW